MADHFPAANQVLTDFRADAERYAALNHLWDALRSSAGDNPAAMTKRKSYHNAAEQIRALQMSRGNEPYAAFFKRQAELAADSTFRRAVLERYKVSNVPAAPAAAPPARPRTIDDVSEEQIFKAFVIAPALFIAGFVAMILVARAAVMSASRRSQISPAAPSPIAGMPPPPESLRVIKVAGLEYSIEPLHGLAFDKETTMHVDVRTTSRTELPPASEMSYSSPVVRTFTDVTTRQDDLVWIYTPDQRETSWNFSGGEFKVRPGQLVSAVGWRAKSGGTEFLLAYNHNTQQLQRFDPSLSNAHSPRVGLAWPLAALVGSLAFGAMIAVVRLADPHDPIHTDSATMLRRLTDGWTTGLILAAFLGFFIAYFARSRLLRRRNQAFQKQYPPLFSRYFEQCTPSLAEHFSKLRRL